MVSYCSSLCKGERVTESIRSPRKTIMAPPEGVGITIHVARVPRTTIAQFLNEGFGIGMIESL